MTVGIKEDLARAKAGRQKPVVQDIVIGDALYQVEARRLDGMQWAHVIAAAPPRDEASALLGYDTPLAALVACREYGRLLDAEGEHVTSLGVDENGDPEPLDWVEIFSAISGIEVQAISAMWWGLNIHDPNQRVVELKKASAGGRKTS